MKKVTIVVLLATIISVLLCACGGNNEPSEPGETVSEPESSQTEPLKTEPQEVKARTAIIFSIEDSSAEGDGGVFVVRGGEEQDAYEGMRLTVGDTVVTDLYGFAYLRIDDDKNILLDASSTMEITEMSDGNLLLSLLSGEFFFDVENKLADGESMAFAIGGATMSIRGTSGGGTNGEEQQALASKNFDRNAEPAENGVQTFSIYTGIGIVRSVEGPEIDLNPGESSQSKDRGRRSGRITLPASALAEKYMGFNGEYKEEFDAANHKEVSSDSSSSETMSSRPQPAVQENLTSSSVSSSSESTESSGETGSKGNEGKVTLVKGEKLSGSRTGMLTGGTAPDSGSAGGGSQAGPSDQGQDTGDKSVDYAIDDGGQSGPAGRN